MLVRDAGLDMRPGEAAEARLTLPDELTSTDVWPLLVEALSTSFRLLPLMMLAPPLRRTPRALGPWSVCSLSLSDGGASSGLWVRFGGIVQGQWTGRRRCRLAGAGGEAETEAQRSRDA